MDKETGRGVLGGGGGGGGDISILYIYIFTILRPTRRKISIQIYTMAS